ncbi:hypothetical protein [Paractinoplanes atraurantiacus]|nr:hypothetical protein [Actinoplanes atraurantiacus]
MINPGSQPVDGAREELAAASLAAFLVELREQAALERETRGAGGEVGEPVRDSTADRDGRFGWTITVNGQPVQVLMPGLEEAVLRGLDAQTPCLLINREARWWSSAVYAAAALPRPDR